MPIIKPTEHTAPVFYPKTNFSIVKYLDFTKFISLLNNKSLFFCRLDKLEDQFEGTTPKTNFDLRVNWYQSTKHYSDIPFNKEEILKEVEKMYEFEKKVKALKCVNCWNKFTGESAALWKIYSDFSKGIMIKSSIRKLEKALESSEKEIKLSEINYIDYNKEIMADGNLMYPIIHKHIAYSYEEEVRLIYEVIPEFVWDYDWTKEEVEEGVYIETNLNELIDEIIISPYSPKWFFKLVEEIIDKYDLSKQINKSQLSFT